MSARNEDKIKQRAYELWLEEGQPHGRHDEHWKQATKEIEKTSDKKDKNMKDKDTASSKIQLVNPSQGKAAKPMKGKKSY